MSAKQAMKGKWDERGGASAGTHLLDPTTGSRMSGTVPIPVSLLGFAAIRAIPGGVHDRLAIRGSMLFGGLRAELTFGTETEGERDCRGAISTSVPLLPSGELGQLDFGKIVPSTSASPSAWLQLTEAGGRPVTDLIRLGALTWKPRPFTFPLTPLFQAAAWIACARDGDDRELIGEIVFARAVSLSVCLVTETRTGVSPSEPVRFDIAPTTRSIPFSAKLAWSGNRAFRLSSIRFVDAAGRAFDRRPRDPDTGPALANPAFATLGPWFQ